MIRAGQMGAVETEGHQNRRGREAGGSRKAHERAVRVVPLLEVQPNPVLGYDIGLWRRTGNFDLTYGLSAAVRTDLKQLRFGVCPSIGVKLWQLHVQTGMYVLAPFYALDNTSFNANTFFISARFLLVKNKTKKGDD